MVHYFTLGWLCCEFYSRPSVKCTLSDRKFKSRGVCSFMLWLASTLSQGLCVFGYCHNRDLGLIHTYFKMFLFKCTQHLWSLKQIVLKRLLKCRFFKSRCTCAECFSLVFHISLIHNHFCILVSTEIHFWEQLVPACAWVFLGNDVIITIMATSVLWFFTVYTSSEG